MKHVNKGKKCAFEGCKADAHCRGFCAKHYDQARKRGDFKIKAPDGSAIIRVGKALVAEAPDTKRRAEPHARLICHAALTPLSNAGKLRVLLSLLTSLAKTG